jgi:hypothetical protein
LLASFVAIASGICVATLMSLGSIESAAQEPVRDSATPEAKLPPTADPIGDWINQLRDDAYAARQAAAGHLLAAGMPARARLLEFVDGPDPETRAAARRLIALIDKSEFQRQLDAFAADMDGKLNLSLPGWTQFRELVGSDAASRALFVEMQRYESVLLADVFDGSPGPQERLWDDRLLRLLQWQVTANARRSAPPLGSCATMFFLGSVPEAGISDRSANDLARLVQQPSILQAMQVENRHDAVRRLVIAWVVHCPNHGEQALQQRLGIALTHKLSEAVPLALAVAQSDPDFLTTHPNTRALAILVVGQLGQRAHVENLEPLLEDATVSLPLPAETPQGPATNVQIRDVALAAMLQLTGQNPADYGYVDARRQPQQVFDLRTLHFANDEQRLAAITKWRAWKAAHEEPADPAKTP